VRAWLCTRHCRADPSGRSPLQRLFSTFPGGRPGIGLLILRAAVGTIATVQGTLYLSGSSERTALVMLIGLLLAASGIFLVIGLLTPVASLLVALCALGIALPWLPATTVAVISPRLMAFGVIITSVAIALLGPGAFSVDGYLFGRREIVIPPSPPES
jgi:TQO small subunit DoxD